VDSDSWLERLQFWQIVVVVIVLWGAAPLVTLSFERDAAIRGQFGDSYGALNTLFSGLAFGAVFYAIILQRRQLAAQQEELRLTRDEFVKSRSAQVLFHAMDLLQLLQPKWRELVAFPADFRDWTPTQSSLANDVSDGLQQVAYFCESELIDAELIMARNALTFVECWRFLGGFVRDYRVRCGEPATVSEGAFRRRHLEVFALRCEEYLRAHHPSIRVRGMGDPTRA
jgi:hypothetical protein